MPKKTLDIPSTFCGDNSYQVNVTPEYWDEEVVGGGDDGRHLARAGGHSLSVEKVVHHSSRDDAFPVLLQEHVPTKIIRWQQTSLQSSSTCIRCWWLTRTGLWRTASGSWLSTLWSQEYRLQLTSLGRGWSGPCWHRWGLTLYCQAVKVHSRPGKQQVVAIFWRSVIVYICS